MNSTKGAHEFQKDDSRVEQGARKKWTPDGQPLIHYATVVLLWSIGSLSRSKLWDLDMQVHGSQKATQRAVTWVSSGV